MSLQVWLPLDGNLNNQGIASCSATAGVGVSVSNDGKIGQCYYFDGSGYLQFNNEITNIISSLDEITFSFWAKPTTTNGIAGIFLIRQNGSSHQINFTNKGIVYRDAAHSSQTTITYPAAVQDTWIHYLFSYTYGNWIVYINGALINNQGYTGTTHLNSGLNEVRIGRAQSNSGNTYYTGYINDFRIYNHALTAEEVRSIVANGLMIHYPMNGMPGDSGTDEYDISGYHNDAILSIGKQGFIQNTLVTKRYPKSYAFDATHYIKKTDFTYAGNIWSASIWYYATGLASGYNCIMCLSSNNGDDGYKKMCASPNTNGNIWCKIEDQVLSAPLIQNAWTHLVLTSDGTTGKVYQNGVQTSSATLSGTISGATCLGIGCRQANADFTSIGVPWHGNLSDFRFYTKCLTADEVAELYNMGKVN